MRISQATINGARSICLIQPRQSNRFLSCARTLRSYEVMFDQRRDWENVGKEIKFAAIKVAKNK